MFDLQLDRIVKWIIDNGYDSVALQLPEGLKSKSFEISDFIRSNTDVSISIIGDPCYGACDLRKDNADALIHFGHSPIPSLDDGGNVLYIESKVDADISSISLVADKIPGNVGILASVQYVHLIPEITSILEKNGKTVFVSEGDKRTVYSGQILGCNCTAAENISDKVDAFLYIGEGDFHPLAAAFGVGKPIMIYDPINNELRNVDDVRDRILRKRFATIQSSMDAKTFLIIVCSKPGQRRDDDAVIAMEKIEHAGRKAYKIVMDEISPERLMHYNVDAYVNTACPRIAMDDSVRYRNPMITLPELDIVLGLASWEEYKFDVIRP